MNEIEKFQEDEITCPYCSYVFPDSWEYELDQDESKEEECPDCEKKFRVTKEIDVTYTTKGLCKENKEKHNWKYFDHTTDGKRTKGRRCLTCDKYEFDRENLEDKK